MGQDPREAWRKLQQALQQQRGRGVNMGPGGPRAAFGGLAGLILLAGGAVAFNNALFNGM